MKKLIVLLVLIVTALAGGTFWLNWTARAAPSQPLFERVDRGTITDKVSATGRVAPKDVAIVGLDVPAGIVAEVLADAESGKNVTKGQPLLRLDDTLAKARLAEAEAALLAAQSSKTQAEAKRESAAAAVQFAAARRNRASIALQRVQNNENVKPADREPFEKGYDEASSGVTAAEAQVKEAESAIQAADSNIKRAQAALAVAQHGQNAMVVKAPISGVIIDKKVTKGQPVSPQGTPVLFLIAPDLNQMQVQAQVGESDIARVRVGMSSRFTVDAYPEADAEFSGKVSQIAYVPSVASVRGATQAEIVASVAGPVLYTVTIDVELSSAQKNRSLKPGYTANVDLIVGEVKNALRVPTRALHYRHKNISEEDQKRLEANKGTPWRPLWLWNEGSKKASLVFVQVGASDGEHTQITQMNPDLAVKDGIEVIVSSPKATEKTSIFKGRTIRI